MNPRLVWHALEADHGVLEINEAVTAPGPALELHVVQDSDTGAATAWWEDDRGRWFSVEEVGAA